MTMRLGSFILLCVVAGGAGAVSACDPAPNEPPPQVPKSARPPDRTEVTMEVSSDPPPGEAAPNANASSPASSAPEAAEDAMSGGVQSDPVVEKAMAPVRSRLNACYKKALAAEPSIGGDATFDATIGKDGRVASARFVKRDGLNEDMVGCLLATVKAMTFDTNKKSQIITLTFGSVPAAADGGAAPSLDGGAKR